LRASLSSYLLLADDGGIVLGQVQTRLALLHALRRIAYVAISIINRGRSGR